MDIANALQPIRRVLVGQRPDGHRTTAVELAIAVAHRLDATVRVVEVEKRHPLLDRLGVDYATGWRRSHLEVRRTPRELADAAGFPADRLEVDARTGRAREVLLDVAREWDADLVVIGCAGVETVARIVLGTATDALVRNLGCPLLVARDAAFPPRSALFPVDLSRSAADAMACGLDFLRQIGALEECDRRALLVVPEGVDGIGDAAAHELRDFLDATLDAPTAPPMDAEVASGNVVLTITERAAQTGSDLLVLGTHGQGTGPISRQMVGSVVAPVLFDPPCNVLLVPPATQFGAELADAVVSSTAPDFDGG